jgi:hypothetical protein
MPSGAATGGSIGAAGSGGAGGAATLSGSNTSTVNAVVAGSSPLYAIDVQESASSTLSDAANAPA